MHTRLAKFAGLSLFFVVLVLGFLATSRAAYAQTCVNDVTGGSNNCTASDVVVQGVELVGDPPVCASENDTVNVTLRMRLRSNARERYDIGLFTARDGGDAFTGQCHRAFLEPVSKTNSDLNLTGGSGPFYNGELSDANDACGDIKSGFDVVYIVGPIQIACRDNDGDGFVDIASVVTWDNNDNTTCRNVQDIAPASPAKCSTNATIKLPIVVPPPELKLSKAADAPLVNAGEPVGFTIEVSNTVPGTVANTVLLSDTLPAGFTWSIAAGSDPGCTIGGTPSLVLCDFGAIDGSSDPLRRVRIVADSTIANCGPVVNTAELTYRFGSNTGRKTAEATTAVACSQLTVDKVTLPPGSDTPFEFTVAAGADVIATFTLTDEQDVYIIAPLTPTLTYSVEEAPVPGWKLTDALCEDPARPGALRPRSLIGGLGVTTNCVFTNTQLANVTVVKNVVGGSDQFVFSLSDQPNRTVNASPGASGNAAWPDLLPGRAYTLSEALNPNWQSGAFNCTSTSTTGTTNFGGPATGVTFTPEPGASIQCAITNTRRGTIIVSKQNIGDPAQTFTFQPSYGPAFSLSNGLSNTSQPLDPGTYSVTEVVPPGWLQTGAACSGSSTPANINLGPGETVTCDFENTEFGAVQVTKSVTSTTGASGVFTFTSTLTQTGSFTLAAGASPGQVLFANLLPGTYSLAEDPAPGWFLESAVCRDAATGAFAPALPQLSLAAGQLWLCDFTNRLLEPAILFEKLVTTADDPNCAAAENSEAVFAGDPILYCFEVTNTGNVTVTSPLTLTDPLLSIDSTLNNIELGVGATLLYTVTANAATLTNTATVSVTSPTGVLTATDDAIVRVANFVINKQIGPVGGPYQETTPSNPFLADAGQPLQWRWTFTNTDEVDLSLQITDTLDGVPTAITCQEGALPNVLPGGDGFTCTSPAFPAALGTHVNAVEVTGCIINEPLQCIALTDEEAYVTRPQLVVNKVVENNWNGPLQVGDFPLQVTGPSGTVQVTSGVTESFDAGLYQIAETPQPGYEFAGYSGDCSTSGTLTLENGQAYQCTLTNRDLPAQLNLVKIVEAVPPYTQPFTLTLNGQPVGTVFGPQEGLPTIEVSAGSHTVGEVPPPPDYTVAIGGDCAADGTVTVANGMTYTCVITNTRAGRIRVLKETTPPNAAQRFAFTPSYGPAFTLAAGEVHLSPRLDEGRYAVVESVPAGWQQLAAACSNGQTPDAIDLRQGETVTCTFANRQYGRILVDKVTNPAGAAQPFDFGTNFAPDFTLRDGERFTSSFLAPSATAGAYRVIEFEPLGWRQSGATCDNGDAPDAIQVAAGETVICTFTNSQEASVGKRVWDDVIADGIQDDPALEPGIPGIVVSLLDPAGNVVASKVTDNDGLYRFEFVPAGEYLVEFRNTTRNTDWTTPNAGSNDTRDSDVVDIDPSDPRIGRTTSFILPPGVYDARWDAGLVTLGVSNSAAVGGIAWFDENKDGLRGAGEPRLAGIKVDLFVVPLDATLQPVAPGTLLSTTTTSADGSFLFTRLNANRYMVRFTAGDQYVPTLQTVGNDITINSAIDVNGETDVFFVAPLSTDTRRNAGYIASPTGLEPGEQPSAPDNSQLWLPLLQRTAD